MSMQCNSCKTVNLEGSTFCIQCGSKLQADALVETGSTGQGTLLKRWSDLPPPTRAATATLPFLLLIQGISTGIPLGLGWILMMPGQVVLFVVQGVLVEKYAKGNSRLSERSLSSLAIDSANWTVLFAVGIAIFIVLVETLLTGGARLFLLPSDLVTGLATILLCYFFTIVGAGLYRKMGGRNVLIASVAVSLVGIVIVGMVTFIAGSTLYSLMSKLTSSHH